MATRTKPLVSAALTSAAAIAVVTPVIAPNISVPTPGALSRAAYELTTFSDVLSIPAGTWTDVLFSNDTWGGTLSNEHYGPDWAQPQDAFGQPGYVNPWAAYCGGGCVQSGIPGVAYMFFDALINGNGNGYGDYENWKVGLVNYLFEPNATFQLGNGSSPTLQYVDAGFSAATWYVLQATIGRLIPATEVPLAGAFWGPDNVSVFYNFGLSIAALVAGAVPLVGPIVGNTLLAYLGDLALSQGTQATYQYGLSGALNYLIDIATRTVPWPKTVPWYKINPAATVAAAAAVAPAASAVAPAASSEKSSGTDEVSDDATEAPETESQDTSKSEAPDTEASETEAPESEASETEAPETQAPESTPAVTSEATTAPKRPLRDAVENAGKQISSALANAKAARAERAAARKAARAGAAG